jgi:hypothetical protein
MLLHLSKAIRSNLPSVGKAEVKTVAKWVQHPMFPLLVQWLFQTAENAFQADPDAEEPEPETGSEPTQPQATPQDPRLPHRYPGAPAMRPTHPSPTPSHSGSATAVPPVPRPGAPRFFG